MLKYVDAPRPTNWSARWCSGTCEGKEEACARWAGGSQNTLCDKYPENKYHITALLCCALWLSMVDGMNRAWNQRGWIWLQLTEKTILLPEHNIKCKWIIVICIYMYSLHGHVYVQNRNMHTCWCENRSDVLHCPAFCISNWFQQTWHTRYFIYLKYPTMHVEWKIKY